MDKEKSLEPRGEEDFTDFMAKTLLIIGQIIAMSGGWSFGLLILFTIFHHKKPFISPTFLLIMIPVGVLVGFFLLALGGSLRRR
jgi:hypothetical protein